MSKHTPGPWIAQRAMNSGWYIISPFDCGVVVDTADIVGRYGPISSEDNARLIKAAPKLLAACEFALPWQSNGNAWDALHEAIIEARGEE